MTTTTPPGDTPPPESPVFAAPADGERPADGTAPRQEHAGGAGPAAAAAVSTPPPADSGPAGAGSAGRAPAASGVPGAVAEAPAATDPAGGDEAPGVPGAPHPEADAAAGGQAAVPGPAGAPADSGVVADGPVVADRPGEAAAVDAPDAPDPAPDAPDPAPDAPDPAPDVPDSAPDGPDPAPDAPDPAPDGPARAGAGDWAFADRPGDGEALVGAVGGHGRQAGGPRRSPLIVGEATHEIPVHLLFRDEVDPAARRAPTVVGRRLGTGEQPRIRRTGAPARPGPPVDPGITERPGPVLPGWAAAFAGALTLSGCLALLWRAGALPDVLTGMAGLAPHPYAGIGIGRWLLLTLGVVVLLFTLGGLSRGRLGHALVLTLFGEYRGSVRRTGLLWISPLLLRRRVDVRLRHWRSEPMPAMDANGTALRVVVLVVWRVRDTVRATLGIRDHEEYLREQVEAALARVLSQLPADAFHGASPTLRNAEAVGDSLTRVLGAECRPAGIEVFSAQPTRIEYAPEIADAMQRSRIAALDARHRDTVLTAVVDAVDETVHRLTARGLVELDDYERKALVKDLTVAFCTGRAGGPGER
ncbi:SPFH domain-containing protein [Streptomyces sp. NPDC047002]|uniref:SPFH domain-containing protein n=1 Tax=Streptomyces sp. NPDC047002 TaxID=3155475 RepID=UPI00345676B3